MKIDLQTPLIISLLILSLNLNAQKEAYNWIYANELWLSFNSNPPEQLPIPNLISYNASFNPISVSDGEGNLLFYSDKGKVYNRDHIEMENGISSTDEPNPNVTHPVFAIPKPESSTNYYLFINSTFESFGSGTLKCLEIDMTLNGGLGGIIPNSIQTVSNNTVDKLTAIRHSNGNDIWVINHALYSDEYHAWLATSGGISVIPKVSIIGSSLDFLSSFPRGGQIKASLDGTKIATINRGLKNLEIFDFNQTTGKLSNLITIDGFKDPQGVEFSPSGRFLYFNDRVNNSLIRVYQLELGNDIASTSVNFIPQIGVNDASNFEAGSMQLGPDGKIYLAKTSSTQHALDVITFPEIKGSACGFVMNEIPSFISKLGLPVFFHEYLQQPTFTFQIDCGANTTTFSIDDNPYFSIDSVLWDFGDPLSGSDNYSTSLNPVHVFSNTGSHIVNLLLYTPVGIYSVYNEVISFPSEINLGDDQTVCDDKLVYLDKFIPIPNVNYLWSNGTTNYSIEIDSPGTYWVDVTLDNCPILTDTVVINHLETPGFDLPPVVGICNDYSVILDVTSDHSTYLWNTGSTSPLLETSFSGDFSVTVTNSYGCVKSDETSVFWGNPIFINPSQLNNSCEGDSSGIAIVFTDDFGFLNLEYLWNTGETTYRIKDLPSGDYTVTVTESEGCTEIQEYTITEPLPITADFEITSDNPLTMEGEGIVKINIEGGTKPYSYQFDADFKDAHNQILISDLVMGDYNITIADKNDCRKDFTFTVDSSEIENILEIIEVFPNPTNTFLNIQNIAKPTTKISINNSIGQLVYEYQTEDVLTNLEINVSNWAAGIYFIHIYDKEFKNTWKVIIE